MRGEINFVSVIYFKFVQYVMWQAVQFAVLSAVRLSADVCGLRKRDALGITGVVFFAPCFPAITFACICRGHDRAPLRPLGVGYGACGRSSLAISCATVWCSLVEACWECRFTACALHLSHSAWALSGGCTCLVHARHIRTFWV